MTIVAQSQITVYDVFDGQDGLQGLQGPSGTNGTSLYTWIKYADTPTTGMHDLPTGKKYLGIAYNKSTNVESTNYADYSWSLIEGAKGDTGSQGIQGPTGANGEPTYVWIKYADSPTTGMSDSPTGKKYLGIAYNKSTQTESSVYGDYSWSLVEGPQGIQGPQGPQGQTGIQGLQGAKGDQGIQGTKGSDGLSSYTHIAYATNATGTTGFSVGDPTNKTYIGMYVDSTPTDSTNPALYKWSLIKGADGTQGVQGPTGANGQTSYFHVAYATNATGTTGFSTTDSVGKTYIGTYTDFTAADSNTPSVYKWSLIKGDVGATGATGATGSQGPTGATGAKGDNGELNLVNNPHNSGNATGWSGATYGTTTFNDGRTVGVANLTTAGSLMSTHTNFNIEPQKMYEFSVWLKQSVTKGTNYFGLYAYNSAGSNIGVYPISTVTGAKTATLNNNAYFWNGTVTANVWQKHTGYIIPAGYDATDVEKFKNLGENVTSVFQFPADINSATMRVLNYTNTVSTTLTMAFPMVKEVDISVLEANRAKNIQDLWRFSNTVEIDGGKLRANTVTATQINVANLSALTSNLGTVTAGTITGVTINAPNMNLTNSGNFKATSNTVGALPSFEILNGMFSHAIGDQQSFFGFTDGDVDAYKGMWGNMSQGRIGFSSGTINTYNGRNYFTPTVGSEVHARSYYASELVDSVGVNTDYLNVRINTDIGGTDVNKGVTLGNPYGQNISMDNNEISSFNNSVSADLHIQPDGGRLVLFNNKAPNNLIFENGEIVNQGRISPSLQNGWVNYGTSTGTYEIAGYWKDKNGVVHLSGLIKNGTSTAGTVLFTLPVGYRPDQSHIFLGHTPNTTAYNHVRIDVGANGNVSIQSIPGGWVGFGGIKFKAER